MCNSKCLKNAVLVATVVLLATGGAWAAEAKKSRGGAGAGVMSAIPAKSLFCVRINKFDATLDSVNAFLKDVAPVDAKAALMSKLTGILGGDQLRGVNKRGTIAIFALMVPSESGAPGPMGGLFFGALLPTGKYENFVSRNSNVGEADEQGISTITVDGEAEGLVTNFRRFALLCPSNAREQLIKVKKMLNQRKRSLGAGLDPETRKQAASAPVWVFLNVKEGSAMLKPMLGAGLGQMKAQLDKAQESGEKLPVDPAGIVAFYGGILNTMLEGTENVTISLAPSAEAFDVTLGVKPVPDSTMASLVGEPLDGDLDHMLGYLEDGAVLNMAGKVDREGLKTMYVGLFELVGKLVPGGIGEADLKQLQTLTTNMIDAMGDSLAITFNVNGEDTPPFAAKYVIEVKDQKAFEEVLEDELKLMEEGVIADLYKGFGMEMDVEIDRDTGTYKGTRIGGAKVAFTMGDEDSPTAQMLGKMFGDGLEYRWAFTPGRCVYTLGPDADGMIRELIDQVKAGGPKQIGSQMKAALAALGDSNKADVVGTLNLVRYMQMIAGFMATAAEAEMPKFDAPTESNIAFAGRTTEAGNLTFQIVMPKQHLLETKSVFEDIIPKIKEQERLKREKKKEKAQANNI